MHSNDEDERISRRLQSPPVRTARHEKAAALVRRHYEQIHILRTQGHHAGKTWEEIGRDLRPTNPVPGGTVARAFARITQERAKGQTSAEKTTGSEQRTGTHQTAPDSITTPKRARSHPFQHSIDPIRKEMMHGDE